MKVYSIRLIPLLFPFALLFAFGLLFFFTFPFPFPFDFPFAFATAFAGASAPTKVQSYAMGLILLHSQTYQKPCSSGTNIRW